MERIEENAKIVLLLLEQLINKEINIEIKRILNDLKIYHVAILNLIIYEWNCYKALTLMEKKDEYSSHIGGLFWRTMAMAIARIVDAYVCV